MADRVQISLDDVKGFFKYMAGASDINSIFDTITLGFLRELHRVFGTEFSLFCMFRSKEFSLEQVPDKYRAEFQQNQDWLHFGFHSLDESSDYSKATLERIVEDYRITMVQVSRITGITSFSDTIRLHGFAGSREVCRGLRTKGIHCLLTADDDRLSYYLSQKECERIRREGIYFEKSEGIWFCRSLTRLEKSVDPIKEMQDASEIGVGTIAVFTHEWQMHREDIQNKIKECCRWEQLFRERHC